MNFSLLSGYAFDTAETVVLWLTVALVSALVLTGIILYTVQYVTKRPVAAKFVKYGVLGFVAYALITGIIMLVLQLVKRTNPNYLEDKYLNADVINFVIVPLLVAFAVILVSAVVLFIISKKKNELFKPLSIGLGILMALGVVAAGITIGIYYSRHIAEDGYYNADIAAVDQLSLYVCAGVLIIALLAGAFVLGRKDKKPFDSNCIAFAGVCIAMSFVLSYVKLFSMPFGGSVTFLSMLPVMLFAYVYGPKKGIFIGLIYGIMQAMQDPYIIHPAQFLLDYPIAFAMVGFAGAFKDIRALKFPQIKFCLGAVVAGSLRYLAHVLSGVFAFSANALDNGYTNFWAYSLAYNSFVFVDVAMILVAGAIILSSKSLISTFDKLSQQEKESPAEQQS